MKWQNYLGKQRYNIFIIEKSHKTRILTPYFHSITVHIDYGMDPFPCSFCFRISICWYWTNMFWHWRDFIAMTYWWWPRSLTWGKATVMLHTDSSSYGSMENSRQVEERWFQAAAFGESGTNSLIHSNNTKDFCHHGLTRTINVIIKLIVQVPFSFKLYNITCYEWFKFQSV